jgi:hypothetical protein
MTLRWVLERTAVLAIIHDQRPAGAACPAFTSPLIGFPHILGRDSAESKVPEEGEIALALLLGMLLIFCELPLQEGDHS